MKNTHEVTLWTPILAVVFLNPLMKLLLNRDDDLMRRVDVVDVVVLKALVVSRDDRVKNDIQEDERSTRALFM
jgi:hypothetical protein